MNLLSNIFSRIFKVRDKSPRKLHLIGYWMATIEDNYCLPQELVAKTEYEHKDVLLNYLRSGVQIQGYRGFSHCRFNCGIEWQDMGSREFTDGYWVWPEGLPHYVESHNIMLPEAFVEHTMKTNHEDFKVPESFEISKEFWIKWCTTNRSPNNEKELVSLRKHASIKIQDRIEFEAKRLVDTLGVGEEKCAFCNCNENALKGKALCGLHWYLRDTAVEWMKRSVYADGLKQFASSIIC